MVSRLLMVLVCVSVLVSMTFAANNNALVTYKGTTTLRSSQMASAEVGYETRVGPEPDVKMDRQITGTMAPARVDASHVPTPGGSAIGQAGSGFSGFQGISHLDQRLADNGNQFSLEPPDQGLAVGNGFVVEAVNLAIAVYNTSGTRLALESLNKFFGLASAIVRTPPVTYGPFTSDPRAYYDASTGRWFVTLLEIDTDPSTGAFLGHSSVLIAVSTTGDPTGSWNLYSVDTTNATNTPDHAGCPCFGDQPLIGADANGFYITTNEFPLFVNGFNGAQIYALSKMALVNGTMPSVATFSGLPLAEGIAYSVQPATTPPGGTFESANGGTEYFMSALEFTGGLDNRIAVWALTNTSSLSNATPSVQLQDVVVTSQVYGMPPAMQQKPGDTPLADLLKIKNNPLGVVTNEHLELVESNDDRMQQAVYAAGSLWSSLNTVVKTPNGPARVGAAWFIVKPSFNGTQLSATIENQGYVAANQEYVAYPSIGVNASGKGVMTFTLVGPDYYPSAAYAMLDKAAGAGPIQIAANGVVPDDGFTGYVAFGGRAGRWGDYSAAVADADGSVWTAVEYIPGGARTLLANWGTFVSRVVPQ